MRAISSVLIAAALSVWLGHAQGGSVGAYICAVDNCGKRYPEPGQKDACRTGVQSGDKKPSDPTCLAMCETSFGPKGKSLLEACRTGCAMFPAECLRDGAIPPPDPQLKRPRTERYVPPPPSPPQQPRYRDYRYRW